MANCNAVRIRSSKQYKKPTAGNLAHNSAMTKATYWLNDGDDIVQSHKYSNHQELNEDWNNWEIEAKARYEKNPRNKRSLRSDAVIIEEGLIIIGSDVNVEDIVLKDIIENFVKKFEKDNSTKVRHWAIHTHEGHKENDDDKINKHIHFLFDNVSDDGVMVRRNWKREYFNKLQDDIYNISKEYIPKIKRAKQSEYKVVQIEGRKVSINKRKHQHHRVFRKTKELENLENNEEVINTQVDANTINLNNFNINNTFNKKLFSNMIWNTTRNIKINHKKFIDTEYKNKLNKELAKQKDLKQVITKLRTELKENKSQRKDYAKLEQLNKELKQKIKTKDLTIDDLEFELQNLKYELLEQKSNDSTIERLEEQLEERYNENLELEHKNHYNSEYIKHLEELNKGLLEENESVKRELQEKDKEIEELKIELDLAKDKQSSYFGLNKNLKQEIDSLKTQIFSLESQNTTLSTKLSLSKIKGSLSQNMNENEINSTSSLNAKSKRKNKL